MRDSCWTEGMIQLDDVKVPKDNVLPVSKLCVPHMCKTQLDHVFLRGRTLSACVGLSPA